MAELTLKTRLLNKMSEGTIADLRKGEINFYPAGEFLVMEVGGTDKPFAALASDVYAWAKAATKPAYTADEIDGLAGYIAGKVQDTNTKYEFVINDNGELVITSKELDGTTKTAATLDILTPAELNTTLASYVTETKLVEELSKYVTVASFSAFQETNTAAIADAKAAGTAASTALGEYKTANDAALAGVKATAEAATTMADVEAKGYAVATNVASEITRVEGLVSAEASRADAAEKKALEDAKAYADGLAGNYDAAGAASAAETAAKTYADGLAVNYDAAGSAAAAESAAKAYADEIKADLLGDDLADTFNTLKDVQDWVNTHGVEATNLSTALAAETKAREEADTALSNRVKDLEDNKAGYATTTQVATAKQEAIKDAADDATSKANTAEANAKGYTDAEIDKVEAEVAKKANTTDLKAIAFSGKTDDLVQGDLVLVFDCGTSAQ